MAKSKDHFLYWVISGVIGVLCRDIYSCIAKWTGLSKFYVWNIGADLFITKKGALTFGGTILGFLTDFVVGGMLGVIIGYYLDKKGTQYYILKGWGVGLLAWLFFFGILFHTLPHTAETAPTDVLSNLSAFIGHTIFGIIAAFSYVKIAKPSPSGS